MTGIVETTAWMVLVLLLAAIAVVDGRTHRIPNGLNAALLASGLGLSAVTPLGLLAALAGAALGGACLLAVALAYRRLRGVDGLGLGDVKFLVGAGAWTGWQGVGPVIFVASVAALLVLGIRRLAGVKRDRGEPIPFGPYLCLALLIVRASQHVVPALLPG